MNYLPHAASSWSILVEHPPWGVLVCCRFWYYSASSMDYPLFPRLFFYGSSPLLYSVSSPCLGGVAAVALRAARLVWHHHVREGP